MMFERVQCAHLIVITHQSFELPVMEMVHVCIMPSLEQHVHANIRMYPDDCPSGGAVTTRLQMRQILAMSGCDASDPSIEG